MRELINMADPSLRDQCLKLARERVRTEIRPVYRVLITIATILVAFAASFYLVVPAWQRVFLWLLLILGYDTLFWWCRRARLRHHVRQAIRELSGNCVNCGYDLTGTSSTICPECGVDPSHYIYRATNAWISRRSITTGEDTALYCGTLVGFLVLVGSPLFFSLFLDGVAYCALVSVASAFLVGGLSAYLIWRKRRPMQWAADGRCPKCGYKTDKGADTQCPECAMKSVGQRR